MNCARPRMHQDYRASQPSRSSNKCRYLSSYNRHSGKEGRQCPAGNCTLIGKRHRSAQRNHSLKALDTGVLDYRKQSMGVNGQEGMYCFCCHLRGSSELSNILAPSPFDISGRLFDRQGGFTRKGWIGWTLCTSLRPTSPHKKANKHLKKRGCALVTCEANRKIVAFATFIPVS
jgi:hypothetical protein